MKKNKNIVLMLAITGAITLLLSCGGRREEESGAVKLPSGIAHFDYFEYEGDEPAFPDSFDQSGEYLNPILTGFYPDPSIEKVGNDYYMVNSSFAYFPGIPVFHSSDLVNWKQIGHVFDRPAQVLFDSLGISRGVFAPAISYNRADSLFYVVSTLVDCGGNFVSTAWDPAGPWTDPKFLPFEGIDPSLFFDPKSGKAYIVNNGAPAGTPEYNGHRAIWMQEFDPGKLEMTGERKVLIDKGADPGVQPIWIEGPHLYKIGDYYYLSAAEGGTAEGHSQVIFRSDTIWGPYEPWEGNPMLTQRHLPADRLFPVTCTGHMDMVETDNAGWWAVFLGCTPYDDNFYNTGRQTFLLPVKWTEDDWPYILDGNEAVPRLNAKPEIAAEKDTNERIPHSGAFTIRDKFETNKLPLHYNFIRTPYSNWYSIQNGFLSIRPRKAAIDGLGQPSFIGRRQQHHYCQAHTSLIFDPKKDGDKAGMVIFQNRSHYYFLGICKVGEETLLRVEKGSENGPVELTSLPVKLAKQQAVQLKIVQEGIFYHFYYALERDQWQPILENADAAWLSTNVAGGFVGAYFGMYAYRNL